MKKQLNDFKVVAKKQYPASFFSMELLCPEKLPDIEPGQFVEVQVEGIFLRRPISIFDVNFEKNTLNLLVQCVGKGTQKMSELEVGDKVNLVYSLGKGFSLQGEQVLLIGGGCGVAPLLYLAKKFKEKGIVPNLLLGGRTQNHIPALEEFEKLGCQLFISTEDGSLGEKGFVTQHSVMQQSFDRIFTCGPNPMMKAVAKIALERHIPCEVSLENMMACGIGACLCCVVKTDEGHQCVCTKGPVFEATHLQEWINS